ncbi:hypothetical protein O0L34_g9272 [Tuta absoluta]|nr:hypothetical protein O0L34_g9272 [Tuta absoluta]
MDITSVVVLTKRPEQAQFNPAIQHCNPNDHWVSTDFTATLHRAGGALTARAHSNCECKAHHVENPPKACSPRAVRGGRRTRMRTVPTQPTGERGRARLPCCAAAATTRAPVTDGIANST